MNLMTDFIDLDLLKTTQAVRSNSAMSLSQHSTSNPPHALMENTNSYSIVMNLLGVDQKDIGIKINESRREIAVLAKKETYSAKRGFFWVFGVPSEGLLDSITSQYKGGVLEIVIPKYRVKSAA